MATAYGGGEGNPHLSFNLIGVSLITQMFGRVVGTTAAGLQSAIEAKCTEFFGGQQYEVTETGLPSYDEIDPTTGESPRYAMTFSAKLVEAPVTPEVPVE